MDNSWEYDPKTDEMHCLHVYLDISGEKEVERTHLRNLWRNRNHIVVHPDGGIWFTDPGYGSLGNYEGHKGRLELKEAVYRIDGKTGRIEKVLDEMYKPNGLCFVLVPNLGSLAARLLGARYRHLPK